MDIQDVSNDDRYAGFFKQLQRTAEQAGRRKGERPRDHRPAQQMIWSFMQSLHMNQSRGTDAHMVATTQVPPPYPPCTLPTDRLEPIMITDMRLETHHRGKCVTLRVLTPPDRITAVMAIAEDENGTATLLQLYHQPDASLVPTEDIIRQHRVCIVKDPFFKTGTNGAFSIRVDHLHDIVWLEHSDKRVPKKWQLSDQLLEDSARNNSHYFRMQGNAAVQHEKWCQAERLYSTAVSTATTSEEKRLAHLNRSLANLKLGHLNDSLSDAITGGVVEGGPGAPAAEKAVFREARALYELGIFNESVHRFQKMATDFPHNKAVPPELQRALSRVHEQQTGEYSFRKMYRQARAPIPTIDCATFQAPVEVRTTADRGLGLFTTRDVKAGDLLVCEKAFAYVYAGNDQDLGRQNTLVLMHMGSKRMTVGGQAQLITQVVQKLAQDSPGSATFKELHCGDYDKVSDALIDGKPVIDTFLAAQIIMLNSFGSPRTTSQSFRELLEHQTNHGYTTCGIWLTASYINHACVGNCRRSFIGDMQIIRATRDLEAGTELRFAYRAHEPLDTYEDVQKRLAHWGFKCDCSLCLDAQVTPASVWSRRRALRRDLKTAFDTRPPALARVRKLLAELDKTHVFSEGSGLRMEAWDPYLALGLALLERGNALEASEALVKALESLGFDVVASPARGPTGQRPKFEIRAWGMVIDHAVVILAKLSRAYQKISPGLVDAAAQYARVAYRIVVGEDDTFDEMIAKMV